MPQDRMTSEGSPLPSSEHTPRKVRGNDDRSETSVLSHAADAATDAWEMTQEARDAARDVAVRSYGVGRRALESSGLLTSPVAMMIAAAAIGYGIAYAVHARPAASDWRVARKNARMSSGDVIATLNGLLQISRDGEEGFRTSAEAVKSADLKTVFTTAARRCAEGAKELERAVRARGGEPAQGGTTSGALHRGWVNLKAAIAGSDDLAILNECERGEDVAKAAYAAALKAGLPPDARSLVAQQYRGVKQNHDRVRDLRNARG